MHGLEAGCGGGAQTTAYQALTGPGQLGKITTGVQFKITNPGDTAVRAAPRCCLSHAASRAK